MSWILSNLGTILVTLALIVISALIVLSLVRKKKKGKTVCSGDCAHCHGGCCH